MKNKKNRKKRRKKDRVVNRMGEGVADVGGGLVEVGG